MKSHSCFRVATQWAILLACFISLAPVASSAALQPLAGPTRFSSEDEFLDYIQQQHFKYFWTQVNPTNGLIRDRSTPGSPCSIAAVGFGLSAIPIAIDRNWITRSQGADRVLLTLETLRNLPQGPDPVNSSGYKGWFYHFLDMNTGLREWRSELSTIDTALLMMGVLDAELYFSSKGPPEQNIRNLARTLFGRIDWNFMLRTNDLRISMEWRPEKGFSSMGWEGYNEAMCLYLLGLGTDRNPIPANSWKAWTSTYQWTNYAGLSFATCPPLFTHQYSHCWIDFREITDAVMRARATDYFENSRRASLAQREYARRNRSRFPNYSTNEWGLTACDGPGQVVAGIRFEAYSARGAPGGFDDGTIAPTAAVSSMPFVPRESMVALRHFYHHYGTNLWTHIGFRDAYNVKANWWGPDAIGIDQGPILLMIENHRTGMVWKRMKDSPVLNRGLERAGFSSVRK